MIIAALQRHRIPVVGAAAGVSAVAMVLAVVTPVPGLAVALLAVAALVTIFPGVTGRRDELVIVEDGFATPLGTGPLFGPVAHVTLIAGIFVAGVHEDARAAWLALLLLAAAPLPAYRYALRHGTGVTLTPDGLRVGKLSGAVFVPWAALDPAQPGQDPYGAKHGTVFLGLASPTLVVKAGHPIDPERVTFPGTTRDFLAAAIRHYAAHPGDRAAIGTEAGYDRLLAATSAEPVHIDHSFRRPHAARDITAGALLTLLAVVVYFWTTAAFDGHGLLEELPQLMAVPGFTGLLLILLAVPLSSPSPSPSPSSASEPTPAAARPSWARDVTNGPA